MSVRKPPHLYSFQHCPLQRCIQTGTSPSWAALLCSRSPARRVPQLCGSGEGATQGWRQGFGIIGNLFPEGPSTQYWRTLVPNAIPLMAFGTRVLKRWLLGLSGIQPIWGVPKLRALFGSPWHEDPRILEPILGSVFMETCFVCLRVFQAPTFGFRNLMSIALAPQNAKYWS